ncbi:MAG: DUF1801 domain-containing protein [Rhodanobacteraceae bacterium]
MTDRDLIGAFLGKYLPEIAMQLQSVREHLAGHFPRGFELIYDNYNALVFGFASSQRASDAIVSVAGYPKWVTLFFFQGTRLPDPTGILEGEGAQVRSIRLQPPARLLEPAVQDLIRAAKDAAGPTLEEAPPLTTIIKSVSARQRARRPAAAKKAVGSSRVGREQRRGA